MSSSKKLEKLLNKIAKEKEQILYCLIRAQQVLDELTNPPADLASNPYLVEGMITRLAVLQGDAYEGLEKILKQIFAFFEEDIPAGAKWYSDLLEQAFMSIGNRPQIFSDELYEILRDSLAFSHVARHVYKHNLDIRKLFFEAPRRIRGMFEGLDQIERFEQELIMGTDSSLIEQWNKLKQATKERIQSHLKTGYNQLFLRYKKALDTVSLLMRNTKKEDDNSPGFFP